MKTKTIAINGKPYTIAEKRNREINELAEKYRAEFSTMELGGNISSGFAGITEFLNTKLTELIPGLTQEDITDGYPSEIAEAVDAIIELNFPLFKRLGGPVMMLAQMATQAKK